MDDLEHSVVIAERDWESFYEESEECSIQPAGLASLDGSSLSDTDDDDAKKSTQEPDLDIQIKPDKTNKEPDATTLRKSEADDCKPENPSKEPESLSYKTDNKRSAEKHTHACLTSDSSTSVNDTNYTDQQLTASDVKDFRKHNENHSDDKLCQATGEPDISFSCIHDAEHVGSSEGETVLKILAKDINGAGSSDRLSNTVVSFPFAQNLSVCEMYDDFFSDFEIGNFLFPPTKDKTVPIFSASHSVVRDLVFPQVEELDIDPDFEQDNMTIRDLTHFSSQSEMSTSPPGMPNLFFSMSQRGNWSSLFSLRRIRFIGKGSTWHHNVSSWIFPKEAKKATSYISRAQQVALLMQRGNNSLLQMAEPQQCAVYISKKEDFIFSLQQADMCLVCIALASWVLKSSNSQSTDMWKAALLANISAISAIQYLRKYGKGHS
ncbi:uncharacterized protein LOC113642789 [Tachysurus ichikawai]